VKKAFEEAVMLDKIKEKASAIVLQDDKLDEDSTGVGKINDEKAKSWQINDRVAAEEFWRTWQPIINENCGVNSGESFIVINGRVCIT
jgi:hypothetical protein